MTDKSDARVKRKTKGISLAIQSGGGNGAYASGALECLLGNESVVLEAISGVGWGAVNATLVVSGLSHGGRFEAVSLLQKFWNEFARLRRTDFREQELTEYDLVGVATSETRRTASFCGDKRLEQVYMSDVMRLIDTHVDFGAVHNSPIPVFVNATELSTGKCKVFKKQHISLPVICASLSSPHFSEPVNIDEIFYCDGRYTGSPAINPIVHHSRSEDILLIQETPFERVDSTPTGRGMLNRIMEVISTKVLLAEMLSIQVISELVVKGYVGKKENMRAIRFHGIEPPPDAPASEHGISPVVSINRSREGGNSASLRWLASHLQHVGEKSTLDLARLDMGDVFP